MPRQGLGRIRDGGKNFLDQRILKGILHQKRHVLTGGILIFLMKARCVYEICIFHADFRGLFDS